MFSVESDHKRTKYAYFDTVINFFLKCCGKKFEDQSDSQSIKSRHPVKTKQFSVGISLEWFVVYFSLSIFGSVGLVGLALTIWSLTWNLIAYSYFMDLKIDTTFFNLVGGLACIPSVFLAILTRKNNLKHVLAFLIVKILAVALLFTGCFLGTSYQLHYNNDTLHLGSTIPTIPLNNTLFNIIDSYEVVTENTTIMDKIHFQFSCCGVRGVADYVEVPTSCCLQQNCTENEPFGHGCLRRIQEDVAWHKNMTISVTHLLLLMYFYNMAMVMSVFISDHYKWKMLMRDRMRQRRSKQDRTWTAMPSEC